jgi:glutamate dehydrogenase
MLLASDQKERGLPRPLLCDLLGYTKMWGYDKILHSKLPESELAGPFLDEYFPKRMRHEFSQYFPEHPLRREIIATAVVNYVVNNGGISLLPQLADANVVAAYLKADRESKAGERRKRVLESGLPAQAEHEALLEIENSIKNAVAILGESAS